jgi:nuclear pore complex protein Nup98-Nup96
MSVGSLFEQKPSFGAFGSSPSQSSPFGSTFHQTKPAFGSSTFGATTTPAFGVTTTPAFGATTTPAFGATTAPAFGATTAPAFGASTTPTFGSTSTSLFGATNAFGSSTPGPAFGTSGTTAFGVNSSPGFGVLSTPAFGFGSSPSVGQTATSFGSSPFASINSPFGAQTSTFGRFFPLDIYTISQLHCCLIVFDSVWQLQLALNILSSAILFYSCILSWYFLLSWPTQNYLFFGQIFLPVSLVLYSFWISGSQSAAAPFGQTPFGNQAGGSRIKPYAQTADADSATSGAPAAKLDSISAMPEYKDQSHEELRWEDYQRGDKGDVEYIAWLAILLILTLCLVV